MAAKGIFLLCVLGMMAAMPSLADDMIGRASVIDGDTIDIRGQRIRLHGIDASESGQACSRADGTPWPCGRQAALALSDFLGARTVRCASNGKKSYDRLVAVCKVGDIDVASWLAMEGWAMAARRYSSAYVDDERAARQARRRIWQGDFVTPRDWRSRRKP